MTQNTLLLEQKNTAQAAKVESHAPHMPAANEPLLREALGATLRDYRAHSGFTLRELASLASVSPGYLSELERGCKEVSSELLASVCHAMGVSVATIIIEAASMMALDAAAAELAASVTR
ncbi:helix-turn-helix domain-containing protein [Corynebacterium sp. 320]|uniref:Helix-turn-helix domain-containing protein n=1 Tax=Corynebacterium zhongnanshanii TaxID=2768834 RepID=A0ABQ6VG35_9CORY|nr:helix-turn-helix domain-containing protein [Corynebacterium sp. 320]KAB1553130.1 helix-turn-helix domain-containing protein [Corynebacterium sp. 321]KAB1553652.1 helix-turn-helix domain-containing protein [Corynebacterium sp. 319]KAB3523379.1 helix-turn-helix domain-containing protein [Corynebacterium zhongnanshanii]KAB3527906.1 helix-turn-helix domain-containing protein [Corynebacterium sp. 250]MCR5913498.1 helix-turn-helix domain-containing protein [Corynebacterium sp. zg254]